MTPLLLLPNKPEALLFGIGGRSFRQCSRRAVAGALAPWPMSGSLLKDTLITPSTTLTVSATQNAGTHDWVPSKPMRSPERTLSTIVWSWVARLVGTWYLATIILFRINEIYLYLKG